MTSLNEAKNEIQNSSHLNGTPDLSGAPCLRCAIEVHTLRSFARNALATYRDLERILGGTVLAEIIKEGETALDVRPS